MGSTLLFIAIMILSVIGFIILLIGLNKKIVGLKIVGIIFLLPILLLIIQIITMTITSSITYGPFFKAIENNDLVKIKKMIHNGYKINKQDQFEKYKCTGLHFAIYYCKFEITQYLIEKGADVESLDSASNTPLMYASGARIYEKTEINALHEDRMNIVRLLLENEVNINNQNCDGVTALIYAVENDFINIVDILLLKGAQIDMQTKNGSSALMFATSNIEIVELLLKNGAHVNLKDNMGSTALIEACIGGDEKIVKLLIDKGAELNVQDKLGQTPLIHATKRKHYKVVQLLKENGADTSFKDKYGKMVSDYE